MCFVQDAQTSWVSAKQFRKPPEAYTDISKTTNTEYALNCWKLTKSTKRTYLARKPTKKHKICRFCCRPTTNARWKSVSHHKEQCLLSNSKELHKSIHTNKTYNWTKSSNCVWSIIIVLLCRSNWQPKHLPAQQLC